MACAHIYQFYIGIQKLSLNAAFFDRRFRAQQNCQVLITLVPAEACQTSWKLTPVLRMLLSVWRSMQAGSSEDRQRNTAPCGVSLFFSRQRFWRKLEWFFVLDNMSQFSAIHAVFSIPPGMMISHWPTCFVWGLKYFGLALVDPEDLWKDDQHHPSHHSTSVKILQIYRILPSGNLLHSYWTWLFIVVILPLKMVIFHSYVSLPEGIQKQHEISWALQQVPTAPLDWLRSCKSCGSSKTKTGSQGPIQQMGGPLGGTDEDHLPSGKRTQNYWKWPFIVSFPIKNGDFHWMGVI